MCSLLVCDCTLVYVKCCFSAAVVVLVASCASSVLLVDPDVCVLGALPVFFVTVVI